MDTYGENRHVSILSISSSILYGGFNTRRYMFVQCFCLYMGGVERVGGAKSRSLHLMLLTFNTMDLIALL